MKAHPPSPARRFFVALILVLTGICLLFGNARSARAASEERRSFANSIKKMPRHREVHRDRHRHRRRQPDARLSTWRSRCVISRSCWPVSPTASASARKEMAARYYPLDKDAKAVTDWATSQGLTVLGTEIEQPRRPSPRHGGAGAGGVAHLVRARDLRGRGLHRRAEAAQPASERGGSRPRHQRPATLPARPQAHIVTHALNRRPRSTTSPRTT